MGADEVGTLKGLTERRATLDRFIGEHGVAWQIQLATVVLAEWEPGVSPRSLWRTRGPVNLGGGSLLEVDHFEIGIGGVVPRGPGER
jgi:hypothetical protein